MIDLKAEDIQTFHDYKQFLISFSLSKSYCHRRFCSCIKEIIQSFQCSSFSGPFSLLGCLLSVVLSCSNGFLSLVFKVSIRSFIN